MKHKNKVRLLSYLLLTILLSACGLDPKEKNDLFQDCSNHYQATSYLAAIKNCEKAAEQGIVEAQWLLANIYYYDLAKQGKKPQFAFKWYLKAAEAGWREAQTVVGNAYIYGEGVKVDFGIAYSWLIKAANQGDIDAEFALGQVYLDGLGREVDVSAAISWYKKAAVSQHEMSINNLTWIYATNTNPVFRSAKKAMYWAKQLPIIEQDDLATINDEQKLDQSIFLDTKAAVFALQGEFEKAVELQLQAIEYLPENMKEEYAEPFQKHLDSYRNQKAWTE